MSKKQIFDLNYKICLACAAFCYAFSSSVSASQEIGNAQDTTGSHNNRTLIQQQAHEYLDSMIPTASDSQQISIEMVNIDERIEIPACPSGYRYDTSPESLANAYISVRVSCDVNQWYLFVNAKVQRTIDVVVTAGMLSPGTMLNQDNLSVQSIDVNRLRHTTFSRVEDVIGARIKHRVRAGQPVQNNMLCFVCSGDRITINVSVGGMQVKTAGIAQQDGVIGDNIRVENANTHKQIIAQIVSTDDVRIDL